MGTRAHVDAIHYDRAVRLDAGGARPRAGKRTARRHCIIAGTGRAGTSFLVQLLTRLGLPTGFDEKSLVLFADARAGLEQRLGDPDAPYIVKSPYIGRDLHGMIERGEVIIDKAYVPMRDLDAAASSRAHVQQIATGRPEKQGPETAGGLWMVDRPCDQPQALVAQLAGLIESLARHDVPTEFLWYPRLTRDPRYLYRKLAFLTRNIAYQRFLEVFKRTVKPEWVSQFTPGDL